MSCQEGCALSALQMRASHAESDDDIDAVSMNQSDSRKCRDFRVACHPRLAGGVWVTCFPISPVWIRWIIDVVP